MYQFIVGSRRFDNVFQAFEYAKTARAYVYVVVVGSDTMYRVLSP